MVREASLHISESTLAEVLESLRTKNKELLLHADKGVLAKAVLTACRAYSITNRSVSVTNQKLLTKSVKLNASSLNDSGLFAQILQAVRRKLNHRGINQIKAGSQDWLLIKTIVGNANTFLAEYNIEKKKGYTKYLEIGMSKMQKYSLNKIPNMHGTICNEYEAMVKLERDKTPMLTRQAYEFYRDTISKKTGMPDIGYDKLPEKYAVFVDIKEAASKLNCPIRIYITSQFESFGFRDGIPDPLQMVGAKALGRVQRYCYEKNINLKVEKPSVDFSKIRGKK